MTRIMILCTNPKCRQHIVLTATTQVRILANEKAEFVHEDLEKPEPELGVGDCVIQEAITPSPSLKEQFEAVMTEWQPPDIFQAIVSACKFRRLFYYPDKNTLVDIFKFGEYTQEDMEYVLAAYDKVEAKE